MTEILKPLRIKIDLLDDQLVKLLVEREKIVREVAEVKEKEGIPVVIPDRIEQVINQAGEKAQAEGGNAHYARQIYKRIIELSCDLENNLIDKDKA